MTTWRWDEILAGIYEAQVHVSSLRIASALTAYGLLPQLEMA